ncbi:hypothetical protein GUITHDRAFT_107759 [Guillardia theta CCMP2712]|uniref:Uncharacterized protein n=1 Tax=Guillardia theta (strain CCMP2712) TaxID=905079 RepID=L1JEM0_GUITC|nr:hypothetical protein GUITHDRAFT_107759 [Guillardia theta CCMP2712]EKX46555.1 hypothetical protein GUITHDRAFT_107759 [Guillardia theta CCMP2712]|eukprot:XP_005833535.1 hypothetical protein GUITHDRAFT_107759 [Guillardia theta CCMP2712]
MMSRISFILLLAIVSLVDGQTENNRVCDDDMRPLIVISLPLKADNTNSVEFRFQFIRPPLTFILSIQIESLTTGSKLNRQVLITASDNFSMTSFFEPDDWRLTASILSEGTLLQANSSRFTVGLPRYAEHVGGAYLRFGDGDISAAYHGTDEMQTPDKNLSREIQAALGMQVTFGSLIILTASRAVYSNCALAHAASTYESIALDFLETLRASKPSLFIGNEHIDVDLLDILFGPQCVHVKVPSSNAYSSIDSIEREARDVLASGESSTFRTVVLALGVSTSALQYRLRNLENLFLFDFGSLLDALAKWRTRGNTPTIMPPAWIKISGFNANEFLKAFCARIGNIDVTCKRYIAAVAARHLSNLSKP